MYRAALDRRQKSGAAAAVIAIHVGLALAFLHLSARLAAPDPEAPMQVFDVTEVPPPPEPPPILQRQRPKDKEGGSAPKNIKSAATPVVAPKPAVRIPVAPPVLGSQTPRQSTDTTQGASDVPGPGTGAGGEGSGTGSGSGGNGSGAGGGGVTVPAGLVRGITGRDYPGDLRRSWPRGGKIFLRLRIEADGRPSKCDVMRSYGDSVADEWTCDLVMQRGIFRAAKDAAGRPIAGWLGYVQAE